MRGERFRVNSRWTREVVYSRDSSEECAPIASIALMLLRLTVQWLKKTLLHCLLNLHHSTRRGRRFTSQFRFAWRVVKHALNRAPMPAVSTGKLSTSFQSKLLTRTVRLVRALLQLNVPMCVTTMSPGPFVNPKRCRDTEIGLSEHHGQFLD